MIISDKNDIFLIISIIEGVFDINYLVNGGYDDNKCESEE